VLVEIGRTVDAIATDPRLQAGLSKTWEARQAAGYEDHSRKIYQQQQSAIERSRKRITRATELFVDGTVDKLAYDALVAKARDEVSAAEKELAELEPSRTRAPEALPPLESITAAQRTTVSGVTKDRCTRQPAQNR
jgi:hypothetical protein